MKRKPLDARTLRFCARKLRKVELQASKHDSEYSLGMGVCACLLANDFLGLARALTKTPNSARKRNG